MVTSPGAVIFVADLSRLAEFYRAMTGLPVTVADDTHVVLRSETFELVIHKIPGSVASNQPATPRRDAHVKPFFPVPNLAAAREAAAALGGRLEPVAGEWSARGFRACEAVDPEGNVIQFREVAPVD